ncbi:hypothetical protein EMIHUDRAFT_255450 [Emiliania huxleyi CCMP1516]|uniref:Ribosome biogenesis protein NOP53 n=2 Tax=Emiliania huxleyi TaxID=2903 RepID=A0A0D3JB07_EMIH1|nr:hypothetical protein EMIHUDRAFT_255450 [Emiliania huxleyi CCMP1516]EOD20692.1 hypothetical protein EMIHUDRAFT_255450 [Emiliania huxleyi CCMP1516]|eukprot:XP_005773121.1 hypothetical protein EMIHUDRAFT_255450 [Emiliania huxleyi CCMP1516]
MPSPDAAARHTGAGVARRQAHHERMRDERAREAAAGDAELPPEDDAVEMASAAQLLDSVAEVGPNYTLLRSKETKAKRRKRQREDARAALDGHTVLSTGSRLEIFCDSVWDKSVENVPKSVSRVWSAANRPDRMGSTPRSLWGCNKVAAERATDGVPAAVMECET